MGVVILASLICLGLVWRFSQMPESPQPTFIPKKIEKEKTMEEIIKDLTTPQEKAEPLPEKIIQELILPQKGKKPIPLSDELIKELTAPK